MEVRSDRTYRFDASPETVWDALGRVDHYRGWWPWLRRFEATGLVVGDEWRCTVRPPVPYVLRFSLHLDEVEPHRRVTATVTGDIEGDAAVTIRELDEGSEVRLISALAPRDGLLRSVSILTPWLARFGHDWVLDTGLGQFRSRAL